jgi:molecular chaperone DnaK
MSASTILGVPAPVADAPASFHTPPPAIAEPVPIAVPPPIASPSAYIDLPPAAPPPTAPPARNRPSSRPPAPGPRLTASSLGFKATQAPGPASIAPPPLLLDVTPLSLGIETIGGMCEIVIPRNATIPVEQTREFATSYDNQDSVRIRIAQGESRRFVDNQVLGELALLELKRVARGEVKIAVTFELDANGTLNVRACEVATGRQTETRVTLLTVPGAADVASMARRQRGQA